MENGRLGLVADQGRGTFDRRRYQAFNGLEIWEKLCGGLIICEERGMRAALRGIGLLGLPLFFVTGWVLQVSLSVCWGLVTGLRRTSNQAMGICDNQEYCKYEYL